MTQTISLTHLHDDPRSANCMAPERFEKLVENIKYTKRTQPLTVRPHPDQEGHYVIIDGHYRVKALKQLGIETVECDVWKIDANDAALLLSTLNQLRGEDHPKKRAELLQGLLKHYDKDRLAQLIPESRKEIDDLLALVKQQEGEAIEKLRQRMKEERDVLEVMLHFVLPKADAERVEAVLKRFDEDKNSALIQLCEEVSKHG